MNMKKPTKEEETVEELPTMGNKDAQVEEKKQESTASQHNQHEQKHHEHIDEEDMVWPIQYSILEKLPEIPVEEEISEQPDVKLTNSESNSPTNVDHHLKYNMEVLTKEFLPRTDVVVLNFDDTTNVETAPYFLQKGYARVVCIIKDPNFSGVVAKTGAIPVYMFSAAEHLLYQTLVSYGGDYPKQFNTMNQIEAAKFPDNVVLIPPPVTTAGEIKSHWIQVPDEIESIQDTEVKPQVPLARAQKIKQLVNAGVLQPIKNFGKDVNDAFTQMKDPSAFTGKRIEDIPVVDETERDEYIMSLGDLHGTSNAYNIINVLTLGGPTSKPSTPEKPQMQRGSLANSSRNLTSSTTTTTSNIPVIPLDLSEEKKQ